MAEKELVTIGIATYNSSSYVIEAINSAINQTWINKEILLIDDCSNDNTLDVVKKHCENIDYIRILRNSNNRGIGYTRNKIINNSNGKFISFFDDDDISVDSRVEKQINAIYNLEKKSNNIENCLCYSSRYKIFENNQKKLIKCFSKNLIKSNTNIAAHFINGISCRYAYGECPTCSLTGRLSVFKKNNYFDEFLNRGEDIEFNVRFARNNGIFLSLAEPLVIQKISYGSSKGPNENYKSMKYIINKHKDLLNSHKEYLFCLKWIEFKKNYFLKKYFVSFIKLFFLLVFFTKFSLKRISIIVTNYFSY